jgi:hypothetical protein
VPERNGLEARLRAMEEAVHRLGTSFDEPGTWRDLTVFAFRTLCDAVAVDVVGAGGGFERVAAAGAVDLLENLATGAPPAVRAVDEGHPVHAYAGRGGCVAPSVGAAGQLKRLRTGADHPPIPSHSCPDVAARSLSVG